MNRIQKLNQQIQQQGLDGVALVPGPNMVYLSGIHSHLSERPVILFYPANDKPAIIIPNLEAMKAEAAGIPPARIFGWSDETGYASAFQQAAAQLKLAGSLWAVESLYMRVLEYELLQKYAPGLRAAQAEPLLMALRLTKETAEIAAIERAIGVSERAMARLVPQIKVGMTEKQLAARLTQLQLEEGADAIAFGPIISTGPNSASPHAVPTTRPLQTGDLLVIDWGCIVDGYPSDITRTFAVGKIDAELRRVYDVVNQANAAGIAAARPGATGEDVDTAARAIITQAGYGHYFIHRTGHGLGLELHEPPFMVQGYTKPLAPGNVFTVEPGIYLPERGGARIEDDVTITKEGARVLTTFTKELITVG